MKSYTFMLILSGVAELTPALANALYAATHGDIELNLWDGVAPYRIRTDRSHAAGRHHHCNPGR